MTGKYNIISVIPLTLAVLFAFANASQPDLQVPVHRYLLSAGANNGGKDKVTLRYAVSDAKMFASVLMEMGGVKENNAFILTDPTRHELLGAIGNLSNIVAASAANVRSEVFVYYSGHADATGLKLGGETLAWTDFREAVDNLSADVKVTVLDACGSGAITRTKGGEAYPVFMLDASSNMKGYAYLTSSNENEASQESDMIRGSFFTHALVSGMRGAADMTGNGRVTVNEAYQYAFNETLLNTQNTRAGTQHPSRDMNLTGTGDIIMTDLRSTSATLILADNIDGRLFIRDGNGNLFTELRKTRGRQIALGVPPGKYNVQMENGANSWMHANVTIVDGKAVTIAQSDMKSMGRRKATVARGMNSGKTSSGGRSLYDRVKFDLTVYADASGEAALSFRAGVPWGYALLEHSQEFGRLDRFPRFTGLGAGTRFGMDGLVGANVDFVISYIHEKERKYGHMSDYPGDPLYLDLYYKVRAGAFYSPLPYLAITGGLSLNGTIECHHAGGWIKNERFGSMYTGRDAQDHRFHAWPGVYIGLTMGQVRTQIGGAR